MSESTRTSAMAVTSLVLGILTLPAVFCCVGYLTGILSVVFGIIGLIAVKNGEASEGSKAMAWAGIITSSLAMIGYAVLYALTFAGMLSLPVIASQ